MSKDKMAEGPSRKLCVSLRPIFAGRGPVILGHLANRLGSRFGMNKKLVPQVIGPKSTPNDYLNI